MKVLVATQPMPASDFMDAIAARVPELELIEYRSALRDQDLADVDAVLAWQLPPGLAGRLPRLGWICSVAAGVEKLLVPGLAPRVRVTRIVDREQAAGIGQFVVTMALRHARDLPLYERQQQGRAWTRHPAPLVRHRTVVLGTGAMGAEIAAWLERAGFVVRGWNRRSDETLEQVLSTAEILVCALPLTAETEGLLGAAAFAAMPKGAYLINVARGAHVVEHELIEVVRSGHLSGAALDVQRREPLPADDPLWTVPGITITPHIAAQPSNETVVEQFVNGVRAWQRGEPLPNQIDRLRGY
jgi:phosphoglycerate dehydrogenase-like enzyme